VQSKRRSGISIAESLIACVLISGISVALFGVWALHAKATAHGRNMMVAEAWARQLMEEQLSKGYETADQYGFDPIRIKHIEADQIIYSDYWYGTYLQDNTASDFVDPANPGNPGLKKIRVIVNWEEQGQWKEFKLVTELSWQG
jgi:Tfp pilus assembly protein PilV